MCPLSNISAYYLNPKYQYTHVLGTNAELIEAVKQVVAKLEPDPHAQALANLEVSCVLHSITGNMIAVTLIVLVTAIANAAIAVNCDCKYL